ncbi:hypothetical protein HA466_0062960 [Hirschfeldia incana]|nr:hypothetical protein HA466_0062960 [Hirschfeldia incana]KAJ0260040.1 hypothetical protein HA466_0062960 [Hirschfeldia incana]
MSHHLSHPPSFVTASTTIRFQISLCRSQYLPETRPLASRLSSLISLSPSSRLQIAIWVLYIETHGIAQFVANLVCSCLLVGIKESSLHSLSLRDCVIETLI